MQQLGIRWRVALFVASFLSMLWGFRLLLTDHAPVAFQMVEEDLSYGWYVPLFSLYVLWRERKELVDSFGEPSAWGLLGLVPSLFLSFLGARGCQIRFEIVGFVGILMSLALSYFGWRTLKRVAFPFLFLLFCIPLHSFLDVITIHLRLFAVAFSYHVMHGFGVDIVRTGTMLYSSSGSFSIDIAEPCSGMRSLFAMMALTAGYAHFTQPTTIRRILLFALSVPIAIIGNVSRIMSIVMVASFGSSSFATGFYHDYSGYVVFFVAISLMALVGTLITKVFSCYEKS